MYLKSSDALAEESDSARKFFTPWANCSFTFWQQYVICRDPHDSELDVAGYHVTWGPLYLAAYCKLVATVLRLVSEGADVNAGRGGQLLPLHCALAPIESALGHQLYLATTVPEEEDPQRSLAMIKALILRGAEVNRCIEAIQDDTGDELLVDPFAVVSYGITYQLADFFSRMVPELILKFSMRCWTRLKRH